MHRILSQSIRGGTLPVALLAGVWLLAGPASAAWACRTPVYRYAMYHWPPMPYRVFYFHHGQPPNEDQEVNRLLDELARAELPANVTLEMIDATKQEQIEAAPKIVQEAWHSRDNGGTPLHLVYTCWGAQLFAGRLDAKTVSAMVDSPARKQIGQLLQGGSGIVWIVLGGADAKETEQAERAVAGVVADAAAGKLPIETYADADAPSGPSPNAADQQPPEQEPPAPSRKLEMGIVKVSRADPAEARLVQMLLAIEPDLKELAAGPMVFAVYGRGRAMPPLVGKGITRDQLTECFGFLTGPCSCMVKDENPGVDLLMRWNWEAAAEAMVAKDPDLREGPSGYEEVSPGDVRSRPDEIAKEPVAKQPGTSQAALAATGDQTAGKSSAGATAPVPDGAPDPPASFAARQMWKIGVALAVVTLVVLAGGLLFVRRYAAE